MGSHPLNERIGKHRGKPGEVIQRAEAMFVIVMAKNRGLMRKSGTREQMVYAMAVAWALASMATSMYDCTSDGCEEVGTTTRVRHAPVPPSTPSVPKVLKSLLNKHFLKHLETHSLLPLRLAYSP